MPEFPLFDLITCHEHLAYEFTQIVLKSIFIQLPAVQETQERWVPSLVRKTPWKRKWQSIPVFLPGKFHGQRSLAGKIFFFFSLILSEVERLPTV